MPTIVDRDGYLKALLAAPRPGVSGVRAFYDHRVGCIGRDPQLMLLPWDDHLVHRGDGVFESMKWVGGKLYQLKPHLERLRRSAKAISLQSPCAWEEIEAIVLDVARAAGRDSGLVRVLLGRGPGGFGLGPDDCPMPSLYVCAYDFTPVPERVFEQGVTAFRTSIPAKQPWLAAIKSVDSLPNVLMLREAAEQNYDVPLCFDHNGFLAESATENVCIVDQQGRLCIPDGGNALAGPTLLRAVDLIKGEAEIMFRGVSEDEVREAREIILVGTLQDALSVVRYAGKPVHDVRPGPVSRRLRQLLMQDLREHGTPL